jgi:2-polyprenyl-3-methyl-5-hydroxy-6-metoxy-1,4-benzoquinol methylase
MKSDIKKVFVHCNSCGADDTSLVTHGTEHEYDNTTDDIFNVVRCNNCGLVYLNPRPDLSELKTIYPDNYYAYIMESANNKQKDHDSPVYKARKAVYLGRLEKVLAMCRNTGPLKVLDVGCGDGRVLNWYREVDKYQVETYGVEFDENSVAKARAAGHQCFLGTFEDVDIPKDFFDLVIATHVIEHVADPKMFAARALEVLKPNGIFLCETPNVDSLDANLFQKQHWGGYHFPRHWVLYTPSTFRKMAESVGFNVERIGFHPAPAFWNWTGHSLLKSWGHKNLADFLFPPADFQKSNLRNFFAAGTFTVMDLAIKTVVGKTSNMSVVMRKPG